MDDIGGPPHFWPLWIEGRIARTRRNTYRFAMSFEPVHGPCSLCGQTTPLPDLIEETWLPDSPRQHLGLRAGESTCPHCVAVALHAWWRRAEFREPIDDKIRLIPFGVRPTTLHRAAQGQGAGVTVALIDSGFFPHPDVVVDASGRNRLRAWADCSTPQMKQRFLTRDEEPHWPAWDRRVASQWHGMMIAAALAGRDPIYPGLASEADLVFVQTWDSHGRITNASITRALVWLFKHRQRLKLQLVNISVGGDPLRRLRGNIVDRAVRDLVEAGIVVVAAAGNAGRHRLLPPATAPHAITVGGLDTRNVTDFDAWRMWHSNWGRSSTGTPKPDVIAPANWLATPILPGSEIAAEAEQLFRCRRDDNPEIEQRIAELKLLSPRHQHVDGTSFAAALVSGVIARWLGSNPNLTPTQVRERLIESARVLPDVPEAKQGAGALLP